MNMIPLKIALHGLIALVPTSDPGGLNHMTALLVNDQMSHGAECADAHHPMLKFLAAKNSECGNANCTSIGNQCLCGEAALGNKEIRIKIPSSSVGDMPFLGGTFPANPLPSKKEEAGSFAYIANFSQMPFSQTLNPDYLMGQPSKDALKNLFARLSFDFGTMTACSLARRDDGGDSNIHGMSFRRLHDPSQKNEYSQALAQKVIAEIKVPDLQSGGQPVTIEISDFGGGNKHDIDLMARPDAYRIDVSNQPAAPLDRDAPCDDGVARHFSMFYELAQNPPAPSERLLPHVKRTQFMNEIVNGEKVDPDVCLDPNFGLLDRPICPMVTFNP
jgi:hypothetical protein